MFSFVCFILSSFSAIAQNKNEVEHSNFKSLNTAVPKSEVKQKAIGEYAELVVVDDRMGAVANAVDDGETESMKQALQGLFPINTVFESSSPLVCIVGVEGSGNATYILSKVNSKNSKLIKKDDLNKVLTDLKIKLLTKEK